MDMITNVTNSLFVKCIKELPYESKLTVKSTKNNMGFNIVPRVFISLGNKNNKEFGMALYSATCQNPKNETETITCYPFQLMFDGSPIGLLAFPKQGSHVNSFDSIISIAYAWSVHLPRHLTTENIIAAQNNPPPDLINGQFNYIELRYVSDESDTQQDHI